jgi:hypothetical protein
VDSSATCDWARIFPHVVADYTRRPRAFVARRRDGEINGLGVRHLWLYIWACEGFLIIFFYSDSSVLPTATFYYPVPISVTIQTKFFFQSTSRATYFSEPTFSWREGKELKPQPSFGVPAASKSPLVELIPGQLETHPVKKDTYSAYLLSQNVQEGCL